MTDHQDRSRGAADRSDKPAAVRLSPPPKIGQQANDGAAEATARRKRADRSLVFWLTGLVFLALGATAFAVFVFLPDWVAQRQAAGSQAEETVRETAAPEPPRPEEAAQPARPTPEPTPAAPPRGDEPPLRQEQPRRPPQGERAAAAETTRAPAPQPVDPAAEAFAAAMTEALTQLDQGDLTRAKAAFERARSLRPGSPEARDGLARVEAERQLLAIADHRERATVHEEQERWAEAAAEYAAVLALDPAIRFAQDGHERSTARQGLAEQLASHLAHPDRLSSDEVLDDARSTLAEAGEIDTPGPVLSGQIERLGALIAVAETPIPVVLLSDGETDLLVFRVGRLGAFERRELDLRPGTYTVVGSRAGYRDVRRTLEVVPGKGPITLTVRCEEKI